MEWTGIADVFTARIKQGLSSPGSFHTYGVIPRKRKLHMNSSAGQVFESFLRATAFSDSSISGLRLMSERAISHNLYIHSKQQSKHGWRNKDTQYEVPQVKMGSAEGQKRGQRRAFLGSLHRADNRYSNRGIKKIVSAVDAADQKRTEAYDTSISSQGYL